jgi:hypothetical protein
VHTRYSCQNHTPGKITPHARYSYHEEAAGAVKGIIDMIAADVEAQLDSGIFNFENHLALPTLGVGAKDGKVRARRIPPAVKKGMGEAVVKTTSLHSPQQFLRAVELADKARSKLEADESAGKGAQVRAHNVAPSSGKTIFADNGVARMTETRRFGMANRCEAITTRYAFCVGADRFLSLFCGVATRFVLALSPPCLPDVGRRPVCVQVWFFSRQALLRERGHLRPGVGRGQAEQEEVAHLHGLQPRRRHRPLQPARGGPRQRVTQQKTPRVPRSRPSYTCGRFPLSILFGLRWAREVKTTMVFRLAPEAVWA